MNLILQIKTNEYIISKNNGTFKYKGPIIKKNGENSKIEESKITDDIINFGVLINEKTMALANPNKLILYNNNNNKKEIFKYKGFSESCYASLKFNKPNILEYNKIKKRILIFGCKKEDKYGFLIKDLDNIEKFQETDEFEINCIFQIHKYRRKLMIEAFEEEYNRKYTYFLVGGYNHNKKYEESILKLYKYNQEINEMEFIKDIGIEKNEIFNIHDDKLYLKSMIEFDYKTFIINCTRKEAIILDNMNLQNNNALHNDRRNGIYSYDLKDIKNMPTEFNDNSIKNIYHLKNGYIIINQENKISVAFLEDSCFSLKKCFNNRGKINGICEINSTQIIISQSNGLHKLVFSKFENNNDGIIMEKINDKKFNLLLNVAKKENENDYIVSLIYGTFRVSKDISSIKNKEDLDKQYKISDKTYDIGTIIEINNNIFVALIDKIFFEIFDINNRNNYYKIAENNWHYILLKNSIVSYKTKEDSNICICPIIKDDNMNINGIVVRNIRKPLNKTIQKKFIEKEDFKISCICPIKQNIKEIKFNSYFLIGGINGNSKVKFNLYKINEQDQNYLSIQCILSFSHFKEEMRSIFSIYQSNIYGEVIIASENNIYELDLQYEEKEERGLL